MTETIHIIGAGLAGLLAANMLKNMKFNVIVHEAQTQLPNNHSAVLRFRTSVVGDVIGIPFKKVQMIKASMPWKNPIADNLAYSKKVINAFRSDRSIPEVMTKEERFIAPSDLISRMAEGLSIEFNNPFSFEYMARNFRDKEPVISTMPMPAMFKFIQSSFSTLKLDDFKSVGQSNLRAKIASCDTYASLYIPNPDIPVSRISITGDELVAEIPYGPSCIEPRSEDATLSMISNAFDLMGLQKPGFTEVKMKTQPYAKIMPVADDQRKALMAWLTDHYNIYSLGRFATWRPGLLLDDLVKDVRLISKWIQNGRYEMMKSR